MTAKEFRNRLNLYVHTRSARMGTYNNNDAYNAIVNEAVEAFVIGGMTDAEADVLEDEMIRKIRLFDKGEYSPEY